MVDGELARADLVLVLSFGSSFSGSTARVVAEVFVPVHLHVQVYLILYPYL